MKIDSDGIHLHQSDLKNHCLEKLRLETVATGPRIENDAATIGTAMHTVIEQEILGQTRYETLADCQGTAAGIYVRLLEQYQAEGRPYALSSFNTHDRAIQNLVNLAEKWWRSDERHHLLSMTIQPLVEWHFDLPFCVVPVKKHGKKAEDVPVYLAGTADLILPETNQIWDWKTAGSEYRRWEYQRWGRQPDVYTWAAHQAGLVETNKDGIIEFTFKVFIRDSNMDTPCQSVTVERSPNNWNWLQEQIGRLVNFSYNMGLDREWPVDDQHVLCSPKWCTFFDNGCKGKFVSSVTWR